RSEWTRNDRQFELEVEIPANTNARIVLPPIQPSTVKIDGKKPGHTSPVSVDPNGRVNLLVGSGIYRISAELGF
ncbi:MAG TPA: alpha-L-rhamnosidase C-terminal domain-containing protein, partial [Prolixibacteraceae bacterium]|nr:alpha-L-rhamnosidase C-terminal domain-containing protein [Prolixibacteraceae bacterium]